MSEIRQLIKRLSPNGLRDFVRAGRRAMAPPPLEDVVLHDYEVVLSQDPKPRVTLVIPDISARVAFGGVTTSIDFLLALGKATGADIRIILDDYIHVIDRSVVDKRILAAELEPTTIEIIPRDGPVPKLDVRKNDVFLSYNWWTTLNISAIRSAQASGFSCDIRPILPLIQDYEPQFYIFSSTQMLARLAFDVSAPCWGVFNSQELLDYFKLQGHTADRYFLVEPRLSSSMRPFLDRERPEKEKILLVYGRPSVPRNCFPAIEKGLKRWVARYPKFSGWQVVSAGLPHKPIPLGGGARLRSVGKLKLEDYAELLRKTAVGLSLMASPHPSYPPLEMAHFGAITITNAYANKDLGKAHANIISMADILPDTIADALAAACRRFESDPEAGWKAQTHMPSFLSAKVFDCIDDLASALRRQVWGESSDGNASAATLDATTQN